mmetsp:Transcript_22640/g.54675  ORF Transcript_22640/g.54675 Transcript_22640/m.54675 type:complete len:335 (-) Transcript_22640:174-1178(-)
MEGLREITRGSAATSVAMGLALSTIIPLGIIPLTGFLKRHKRSINRHIENKDKPDNYAFVVTRTIVTSGAATGIFLHIAAHSDNILWSFRDATPVALVKTFAGCFLLREFFGYWSHRFLHSKLLYKRFHEEHHAIVHVHDDYDGYYIDLFEVINAAIFAYLPAFILPQVHIIAVIVFEIFAVFVVLSVNHCGRDVQVTFDCFGYIKPLVLYNSQYHDDHHVYRRGNYAEMLPILDHIFGTAIVLESRRPLPAQKNWKKAQKVKTAVKVAAAFRRGGSNRAKGQEANLQGSHRPILQRAYDSISGSSRFVEAFHLLCEEEDDCRPQFERLKAKDA